MPGRTPNDVRDKVIEVKVNNPGWGAIRVHAEVTRLFGREVVSRRTVGSILADFPNLSREDIRALRYVRWPETFESGDLPWEAAPAVVKLLRMSPEPALDETGEELPKNVSVGVAEWFWRLTTAEPDGPAELDLAHLIGAFWLHVSRMEPEWHERVRRRTEDSLVGRKPWRGFSRDVFQAGTAVQP